MRRRLRASNEAPHLLPKPQPLLIVLSGPSGAGKDAILARMRAQKWPLHYTVTATTRPPRPQEREGGDYLFLSPKRFQRMAEGGGFLEWAQVYGNWYGVPKEQTRQALDGGQDVIIKVDVQGAATIKRLAPQALFIFVVPGAFDELEQRLRARHAESGFDMALRRETAREELKHLSMFDYVVTNPQGDLDAALSQIRAIITAEKCRVKPRLVEL